MKRKKPFGKSARRGNAASPYSKYNKKPYSYAGEQRLAGGDLRTKANDKPSNRYQ